MRIKNEWRVQRARTLAGTDEQWQQQLERNVIPSLHQAGVWAHPIDAPELGAMVISSAFPESRASFKDYMKQGVFLITDHEDRIGTAAILLNRPSTFCIGDVLQGPEVQPFANHQIYLGGESGKDGDIGFMHRHPHLSGTREVLPGICIGGSIAEAAEMVRNGLADPEGFRFFLQHTEWGPGELLREVSEGHWYLGACSHELLVRGPWSDDGPSWRSYSQDPLTDPFSGVRHVPLWREVMRLLGGKHALLGRDVYNEI
eukprot:CAMPEP_0113942808 /NCGR_PEP_ID=MMETSP1339-20121228/9749_1 /TAXON_ID=94617 /ORGANISM="Fibrocapsa japonica" /LENGTH=257 /DNA_ID=CAMNT_0000947433 /DNA_START=280 /DNA_END=1053 /DNA_ORIENTATION=+ /assembly_acc=CAM_ASM_000762